VRYSSWAPLAAFAVSLLIAWSLINSRVSRLVLDHPNDRSLHRAPIPRTGGVAIQAGVAVAALLAGADLPAALWTAWAILVSISLYDDVRGAPIALRLGVHLFTAGATAAGVMLDGVAPWAMLVASMAIAWMTNLYNFMDGADGLAGGMTLFGFSFFAIASWIAGDAAFALLNAGIAASGAAFLFFNRHPARIFMGDTGSIPLGFLAGALGLAGWVRDDWNGWFPLAVFSPFVADATITLIRGIARGERVWIAHRDHYYQRLVQLGWGHRRTAWAEYGLMAICGAAALAALGRSPEYQIATAVVLAGLYAALAAAITRVWNRGRQPSAP
jgi:UDP-N-acetylmuramyl pentapeptide phosphotransferase/UDP-N-acetylglucosamine-1-phosphate transferase